MAKIANCPICGKRPTFFLCGRGCKGWEAFRCCGAEIEHRKNWNRYAAAMELAKAEVAASNVVWSVPMERLDPAVEAAEDMLFQARMRVLEVFK